MGVGGSVTVNTLTETTRAYIGNGARINETNTSPGADQDVVVRASDDTRVLAIAGAVQYGGSAGVGAGVDVEVINKFTNAYIAPNAIVRTNDDVVIIPLPQSFAKRWNQFQFNAVDISICG